MLDFREIMFISSYFTVVLPSTMSTIFHKPAPSLCFPLLFCTCKALYVAFTWSLKYGMNFGTSVNLLMVFSLENTSLYLYHRILIISTFKTYFKCHFLYLVI